VTQKGDGELMELDAVIFDMDGTLFQTNQILEMSLEDAFERLRSMGIWEGGTPIGKYRDMMGVPLPKVWEVLLPHHSLDVRESMNDYFQKRLIENIQQGNGELYPNVIEVLTFLKQKQLKLFIASNGLTAYLHAIVHHFRLDRWVDETFSIEQIQSLHKSDLVEMILMKHSINKAAVVGDRLSDINAAKDNGLISVGCRFDFSQEEELVQADAVIDDLQELKELFPSGDGINTAPAFE
jgi:adenosylhomocysteine nucleosidase